MAKITKIYGGAGTGKTTFLKNLIIEKEKKGVLLKDIGFFSFSKAAINEAILRVGSSKTKLPYFKTLHSLAFSLLNMRKDGIFMQPFKDDFNYTLNDKYINTINYSRNALISIAKANKFFNYDLSTTDVEIFKRAYFNKLNNLGKTDFTGMLEKLSKVKFNIPLEILIIDEAQDLTPLQWKIVDKLIKCTKQEVYLAGDDDQVIYTFAGVNSEDFLNRNSDEEIVLNTNYRSPQNIFDKGYSLVKKIKKRKNKKIKCIKKTGKINNSEKLIFNTEKTVLYLFRYLYNAKVFIDEHKNELLKAKNVLVSTIHKAKGSEADIVVLDCSLKAELTDDERRVFYVAMTRAKEEIYYYNNENF